ncbi:MAG TPA: hypothetical protein VL172_15410 [Kofleriaceae bacterium]|nr:hypothetical protein [Kofleriaceae bacterium]
MAAGGLAVPACSTDDSSQSTLTVDNRSDFVIEQIYITDTNASGWGPNLISPDALFPGEQVVIDGIECGTYDTLLVDETGLECQLLGIDLCFDDATWVITNNTCDVFAAAAHKNAAQPQSSAPGAVN